MPRSTPVDIIGAILRTLDGFRASGQDYPCREDQLVQAVCSTLGLASGSVLRVLKKHATTVRQKKHKGRGEPSFVVFAGDECLIHKVDEEALIKILEDCDKPLPASEIAKKLRLSADALTSGCLVEQLHSMAGRGLVELAGDEFRVQVPARDLDVIDTVEQLKREGKYPVSIKDIHAWLAPPKTSLQKLKRLVESMALSGALNRMTGGRSPVYMLAGDDERYGRKADEQLKFELLMEIEELKRRLAEVRLFDQSGSRTELPPLDADNVESVPCRVADTVERIAQRSGRRTVELWELRRELAEIPRKALDEALQALGRSRVLELKPVQDATRLTTLQREGILTLNDGVQVLSVALFAQTR